MSTFRIQFTARAEKVSLLFVKMRQAFWMIGFVLLSSTVLRAAPVTAQVYSVAGTAEFAAPGSTRYAPLKKGQVLAVGTTIRTGDDGIAVLVTTPGSAIQIGNSSLLKLNDLAYARSGSSVTQNTANLQLTSGVVSALVDPHAPLARRGPHRTRRPRWLVLSVRPLVVRHADQNSRSPRGWR